MIPNFVVYLKPDEIEIGCQMVKNLQKCGYSPLLSDSSPRLTDIKILSNEKHHHGLVFFRNGDSVLPRDFNASLDDIAVVVWYNYDMREEDLKPLASFFKHVLMYASEPKFDPSNGLLEEYIQKSTIQIASKMEVKMKREHEE